MREAFRSLDRDQTGTVSMHGVRQSVGWPNAVDGCMHWADGCMHWADGCMLWADGCNLCR